MLLILKRRKVNNIIVLTTDKHLSHLSKFISHNFLDVVVDDVQNLDDRSTDGVYVLGYGVEIKINPTTCEKLVLFLNEIEASMNNSASSLSIDENSIISQSEYDPKSFFKDSSPEKIEKPERQKKLTNFTKK
jgi:hypothetical protein